MAYFNFFGDAVVVAPFVDLPDGPTADAWTFTKEFKAGTLTYRAIGPSEVWTEYQGSFDLADNGQITGTIDRIHTFYIQEDPFIYEGQEYYNDDLYVLEYGQDFTETSEWLAQSSRAEEPWLSDLPEVFFAGDDSVTVGIFSVDGEIIEVQSGAGDDEIKQDFSDLRYFLTQAGSRDISDIHDRRLDYSVAEYLDMAALFNAHLDGGDGDDTITGAFGDNTLIGGNGDDRLSGGGGNDRYIGGPGNDNIFGSWPDFVKDLNYQADTAVYGGNLAEYQLMVEPSTQIIVAHNLQAVLDTRTSVQKYLSDFNRVHPEFSAPDGHIYHSHGIAVVDRVDDRNGADDLTWIGFLEFADQTIDLSTLYSANRLSEEQARDLAEIYIAFFDRAPDAMGLYFWAHHLAEGMSLETIADHFSASPEAQSLYPFNGSAAVFVVSVYENVLNRVPDAEGMAFWIDVLNQGEISRSALVLEIIRGVGAEVAPDDTNEAILQRAEDAAFLEAKSYLGLYFSAFLGMSDVENGTSAMNVFDGSEAGFAESKAMIDNYYETASDPVAGELIVSMVGITGNMFDDLLE